MKLTPLDIRKQDFARALRGYDAEEVQAFLRTMADQWEDLLEERRRHETAVRDLKAKMEHYERVEEALQEALMQARRTSEKTISNAEREAEVLLKEARAEAEDIKRAAKLRRDRLKEEATHLGDRRSEVAAQLRAFLMAEMEMLARFEGKDPAGFIKLLPAEERRRLRAAAAALPPEPKQEPVVQERPPSEDAAFEKEDVSEEDVSEEAAPVEAPTSSEHSARKDEERSSEENEKPLRDEQRPNAPGHSSSIQGAAGATPEASPSEDALPAPLRRMERDERAESERVEESEGAAGEYEAPEEEGGGSERKEEVYSEETPEGAPSQEAPPEERSGWSVRSLLSAGLDDALGDDALSAEEPLAAEEQEDASEPGAGRSSPLSEADDVTATSEEIEKIRRILNDMD